jgi:transposase
VHDTEARTWRHMDFFHYQAFLLARVPRTPVPRARGASGGGGPGAAGVGFTVLFEALLIEFATAMPVARVAA